MCYRTAWPLLCLLITSLAATSSVEGQFFRGSRNERYQPRPATPRNGVESEHFVVYAPDTRLAQKVSQEAERFRESLAQEWLGQPLPEWLDKCPIEVQVAPLAGGETSFGFVQDRSGKSRPIEWQMKIYGPPDRILDAVLPHEITHTIFATHFGQPLPRWADEGACTTVEHQSEREKNHQMLIQFLSAKPSQGIPFNQMFQMRQYPDNPLPLYAQGYSLARYLIQKQGKRHFVDYVGKGLALEKQGSVLSAWNTATRQYFDFEDLSELQVAWMKWVRDGCPKPDSVATQTAKSLPPAKNPNAMIANLEQVKVDPSQQSDANAGWYHREMKRGAAMQTARVGGTITRRHPATPESQPANKQLELPRSGVYHRNLPRKTIWR